MNPRPQGRTWSLYGLFALLTLLSILGLVVIHQVTFANNAEGRQALVTEIGKGLVQVVAIGVIGALIKLLFDDHERRVREGSDAQARLQQRRDQLEAFRTDKIRRLVQVTNSLRRAPILIDAHRSARIYNEQMRAVVDAGLELRLLRHETDALGPETNPAFPKWPAIRHELRSMEDYFSWLQSDFRFHSKRLSELQRGAEDDRRRQSEIWQEIRKLDSVRDLLEEVDSGGPDTHYAKGYLKSYENAIRLMIQASIPG
jgi:hypothetical protein